MRPLVPYGKIPMTLLREPVRTRFQSPEEHRFFQLYVTKTSAHLSGFYSHNLWNQIVLQASEAEESIRHAVISIGALDMTALAGGHSGTTTKALKEDDDHHVFALRQYSKAINSLRNQVFGTDYDLRMAVVASLLIVCFEMYHGNYESAHRQTKMAIRLIDSRSASVEDEVNDQLLRAIDRLDIQVSGSVESVRSLGLPRIFGSVSFSYLGSKMAPDSALPSNFLVFCSADCF